MNRRIGNHFDWEFLQTRMYTPNWQSFPVPLAFQINALMTHHPSTVAALTRRSVLVTEAKGHGTHVSKFVNNRLSNPRRCPEKETTQAAPKRRFSFTEKTARKQQMPMLRTAMLRAGSSFGEAALDTGLPRQATVRCEEKCWVAVLRRQDFHDVLMNCDTDSHRAWCSFAAAAPVLRELPEPVRVRLVAHCRTLQVEKAQRATHLHKKPFFGLFYKVVFLVEGNFQVFAQPGGIWAGVQASR
eukprot:s5449_g3.t1